ncbi:hypothetical protein D9M71_76710 [compost metagenome]
MALGLLQVIDQLLVLETPQQPLVDQPIDLPSHNQQRAQQNQAKPAPTTLQGLAVPEQVGNGW